LEGGPVSVLYRFLVCVFAAAIAACGGGGGDDSSPKLESANTATYSVTFMTVWDDQTFPTNFPAGRHFSGVIGATHNAQVVFWEAGQLASAGIEDMAENGGKQQLGDEIDVAIAAGTAEILLSGGGIPDTTDTVEFQFDITTDYPLVTLVSMVAPSPDWFVGVDGLSLRAQGDWEDSITVELAVYDAGTDDGLSFNSADADTNPQGVITRLSSAAVDTDFLDGVHRSSLLHIGTFTFTRIP